MFQARRTACEGRGGKEKGELHGQSMECECEVCRGLILGKDRTDEGFYSEEYGGQIDVLGCLFWQFRSKGQDWQVW